MSRTSPSQLFQPFEIVIQKSYWADQIPKMDPSMLAAYVPEVRMQVEPMFMAKPSAKFPVVEYKITNRGAKPHGFGSIPWITLQNTQDAEFAEAQGKNVAGIFQSIGNRRRQHKSKHVDGRQICR